LARPNRIFNGLILSPKLKNSFKTARDWLC
jgi:hypothetical protein